MADRVRTLIEEWFPIEVVSIDARRERGAFTALPPTYYLHVWWARRPLVTSRASILASLLPAWSENWPRELKERFPDRATYERWFPEACGILGDPVAADRLIRQALQKGIRIQNPHTHPRAFTISPSEDVLAALHALFRHAWGTETPSVLDAFAGGGSIPFEARRYSLPTIANELNPVAAVILKATLDYPFRFGPELADDIRKYGEELIERVRARLRPFFSPLDPAEEASTEGVAYIWAHTVPCPYTGKPVPLSPNWWLRKGKNPVAIRPVYEGDAPRFEIVEGKEACDSIRPGEGTVRDGDGISPWARSQPIGEDYIKDAADNGKMGRVLCALALKKKGGFDFRAPTAADEAAARAAEEELHRRWNAWEPRGLIPTEPYPEQTNDLRPLHYGMKRWCDFFTPRQLLSLVTWLEEFQQLKDKIRDELPRERAHAVLTYLALSLDKAVDYNSRMAGWETGKQKVAHTFDRHDFAFMWSHGEFDASRNFFPWTLHQVTKAYRSLAALAEPPGTLFGSNGTDSSRLQLLQGPAQQMASLADGCVDHVNIDPPYYDNVMYAELADFFYVWLKRSLGDVFPEWFASPLTDKDTEAVANPAKFAKIDKKKKKELARKDYERKMQASFREIHRVLREDGVLTVMFTHKKSEAWDTLASSLIRAGFGIHTSWPVHTEPDKSLNIAKRNAARSTILLACRKRAQNAEPTWWDDIRNEVRRVARERAEAYHAAGIHGVDLYLAVYGPTLAVISSHWPVLTSETDEDGNPRELRPEQALAIAREEVLRLRKEKLLHGRAIRFDQVSDWVLLAWDTFRAREFPADEARKLALALGLDLEDDLVRGTRLLRKKGDSVVLNEPKGRRTLLDPDAESLPHLVDVLHLALLLHEEDGPRAAHGYLRRRGLHEDATFRAFFEALLNAIPRVREKTGDFALAEARTLEALRAELFDDIRPPADPLAEPEPTQGTLFDDANPEEDA